jgi:hypothetical protein
MGLCFGLDTWSVKTMTSWHPIVSNGRKAYTEAQILKLTLFSCTDLKPTLSLSLSLCACDLSLWRKSLKESSRACCLPFLCIYYTHSLLLVSLSLFFWGIHIEMGLEAAREQWWIGTWGNLSPAGGIFRCCRGTDEVKVWPGSPRTPPTRTWISSPGTAALSPSPPPTNRLMVPDYPYTHSSLINLIVFVQCRGQYGHSKWPLGFPFVFFFHRATEVSHSISCINWLHDKNR